LGSWGFWSFGLEPFSENALLVLSLLRLKFYPALSKARFLLFAFWWGALGAVGVEVVPLLFKSLESKAQAGQIAAQLFVWTSRLTALCGLIALICLLFKMFWARRRPQPSQWGLEGEEKVQSTSIVPSRSRSDWLLSLMALGLSWGMLEWVIPGILLGERRAFWHAMGSGVYLLEWGVSGAVLMREAQRCFGVKGSN